MIWNPNKECMPREQMRELQGKRLCKLVQYVYHNVPFYRHKMQEMDLTPDDIRSIDDITNYFYYQTGFNVHNYPYGLMAAPPSEVVRVHALLVQRVILRLWAIHVATCPSGRK